MQYGNNVSLEGTELHALYSSPDIIPNIKFRRLRWGVHVAPFSSDLRFSYFLVFLYRFSSFLFFLLYSYPISSSFLSFVCYLLYCDSDVRIEFTTSVPQESRSRGARRTARGGVVGKGAYTRGRLRAQLLLNALNGKRTFRLFENIRRPEFECSGPQLEGPEFECSGPQLEGPEFEYSELSLRLRHSTRHLTPIVGEDDHFFSRLFNVDGISENKMVLGDITARIRHKLPDIRFTVKANLKTLNVPDLLTTNYYLVTAELKPLKRHMFRRNDETDQQQSGHIPNILLSFWRIQLPSNLI
ncbi:hypothetical protein ANN_11678 [Periplaneta americana]|uniref:Uncharacterized protein n=1 Tax=Periplaneta americana TaxID=6978 RepID=A0ABQ8T5Q3_PERAM|nr:hypothetical protein ANN_11678 [Periplaneta americana]